MASILRSATQQHERGLPPAPEPPTRADELLARFAAQTENDATHRAAARVMKLLAGLDPTPPPLNVHPIAFAPRTPQEPDAPSAAPPLAAPARRPATAAAPDALPASAAERTPRARRPARWLALLALVLLSAGLACSLRPDLLAAIR
jgi:hypothetical protein